MQNKLEEVGISQVIIGAMTGTKYDLMLYVDNNFGDGECPYTLMPYGNKWMLQPPIEWVEEIVTVADKAGIPVFLKDNLEPLFRASFKTIGELCDSKMIKAIEYPSWRWLLRQEMPSK